MRHNPGKAAFCLDTVRLRQRAAQYSPQVCLSRCSGLAIPKLPLSSVDRINQTADGPGRWCWRITGEGQATPGAGTLGWKRSCRRSSFSMYTHQGDTGYTQACGTPSPPTPSRRGAVSTPKAPSRFYMPPPHRTRFPAEMADSRAGPGDTRGKHLNVCSESEKRGQGLSHSRALPAGRRRDGGSSPPLGRRQVLPLSDLRGRELVALRRDGHRRHPILPQDGC